MNAVCYLTASEGFLERGEMQTLPEQEEYVSEAFHLMYDTGEVRTYDGNLVAALQNEGQWRGCWKSAATGAVFSDVLVRAEA